MSNALVLTVSQINRYIKSKMEEDENLSLVYVKGEISNFVDHYKTGHLYFTLKDSDSVLKAVMFKAYASQLRFQPEDGMKVIIKGSVSVYEKSGQYQLYATEIQPDGIGDLHVAFEQLKAKLSAEGLFDPDYKKPLPFMPQIIGVVTSDTGAALQDILRILSRRYPVGTVRIFPVLVQGENAPGQIARTLRYISENRLCDVIITGRGGGSIEELWSFNTEEVARAVFACEIPVISAVGHETDFTIADFVADVRASTPSAAAEIVAPDISGVSAALRQYGSIIRGKLQNKLTVYQKHLEAVSRHRAMASPAYSLELKDARLSAIQEALFSRMSAGISRTEHQFKQRAAMLQALSPLNILARGYSIAYMDDDKIISRTEEVSEKDEISLRLTDGSLSCTVNAIQTIEGEISP